MVLESTIICFDNSDYQRNGDYVPTRLNVQKDCVNLVCLTKLRSNPENNVGLITTSGVPEVLATLTSESGKIFSKLHLVQPKGNLNFLTGIRIGHLALKHRQGKNHKMRIVAFVGSPIDNTENELVKIAKRLKKEKVNVDVVNFGDHEGNIEILTMFINALNGKDGIGSHLINVPRGSVLSDALVSSPIILGDDGTGNASIGTAGFEFGVDPNEDPELALALRVSMEEQRQRQENERGYGAGSKGSDANGQNLVLQSQENGVVITERKEIDNSNSEEEMLQRALVMSAGTEENLPDFSNMTEEEQIAFAMQMSMEDANDELGNGHDNEKKVELVAPMEVDEDYSEVIGDPDYLRTVLENLPGVDPESEAQRDAVSKKSPANKEDETK